MSMDEMPDDLNTFLATSGWAPGRQVGVDQLQRSLRSAGFYIADSAIEFLSQFGFLRFNHEPSILLDGKRSYCWTNFDPRVVSTSRDARIARRCANLVGEELSPVGEDGFHLTIYTTDSRRFFAGRDASVFKYADSAAGLFRAMRDGVRPTRIGDWKLESS